MDGDGVVSVKEIPMRTVVFLRCNGSWRQLPKMIDSLNNYVEKTLMMTTEPASGIFYNQPDEVAVDDLEWDVFLTISRSDPLNSLDIELDFRLRELPNTIVASIIHRGSYRKVAATYERLEEWITREGYSVTGPSEEVYFSVFGTPEDSQLMEIRIPIKPVEKGGYSHGS